MKFFLKAELPGGLAAWRGGFASLFNLTPSIIIWEIATCQVNNVAYPLCKPGRRAAFYYSPITQGAGMSTKGTKQNE